MSEPAFPQPLPTDPEDVSWALSTGQAMWARGDRAEAIRWIKRASDSAADAGDDDRALALARLAAELKSSVGSMVPPPDASAAPPPVPAQAPAPAVAAPEPPARPGVGARGTMMMSAVPPGGRPPVPAASNPAPSAGRAPAGTVAFASPAASNPAPTASNPAPTAGSPAPTAGSGFKPRPPGATPMPGAGARPSPSPTARPQPTPGRPAPPPTADQEPGAPVPPPPVQPSTQGGPASMRTADFGARAFEMPPKLRAQMQEQSSTAITPAPPMSGGDPDDWPTHAFSGDAEEFIEAVQDPPQLMNEGQATTAAQFHPSSPAQFYTPASARSPSAVPAAAPEPPVGSSPQASPAASAASLAPVRVWIVPTAQGPFVVPASRPRPEGAIEAVLVAAAGSLDRVLG